MWKRGRQQQGPVTVGHAAHGCLAHLVLLSLCPADCWRLGGAVRRRGCAAAASIGAKPNGHIIIASLNFFVQRVFLGVEASQSLDGWDPCKPKSNPTPTNCVVPSSAINTQYKP